MRDLAKDVRRAGAKPDRPDHFVRTGNAGQIELIEMTAKACAEPAVEEDVEVVVAEDEHVAARLADAAVVAFTHRAGIGDADDLVWFAGKERFVHRRGAGEAVIVDAANDAGEHVYFLAPFFSSFAHVSLSVTVRLKTGFCGVESLSTVK